MLSNFWVKQRDAMQCGVASLAMICRLLGRQISLSKLEEICQPTAEGVSMKGIQDAAQCLGLKTHTVKVDINHLNSNLTPSILHWNQNHFVVLYKVSRKGIFYVADPGRGLCKYSKEEFKKHWVSTCDSGEERGVAMLFESTDEFRNQPSVADAKSFESFRVLYKYVKRYRLHLAHVLGGLVIGCVLQLLLPFLTQSIVDIGIKHEDISFIWLVLFGELMIVAGRAATDIIRRRLLLHISMRVNISLVSDFFIKLLQLPMSFFDTKLMGDLLQRIADHSRVQNFLTTQLLSIIFNILSFVIFGAVLWVYNPLIFLVFLCGSLIYGGWIAMFLRKREVIDYELFEQQAINQNKTYQFVTTMQEIKLQDCESCRREEWADTQADLFDVQMKSLKLQQTQEAGSLFINEVKNILITVLAATAVIKGDMTLGAMLAVQYIIGQLNSPVEQFMSFIYSLQDVKISLERINEIHAGSKEETSDNQLKEYAGIHKLSFENVNFKYDPHSLRDILSNITFEIPAGKVTAIVGASGSGKTTLIKLLLGYYKPLKGKITVAGKDLNDYNLKWWRRQCGVVMQDGVIFSESIARNIAVGDGDIDIDRLESAANIANIHEYIMRLPLRYNTIIGRDGVGLSQGQRQRILIARAVYKNPDFIFLDEATNALDAKNERNIVENLDRFYQGRTVVVVAHRLSTVKNADQIIVLDSGKVVEVGDHTSLIEKKGAYFNLVKNQLELGN